MRGRYSEGKENEAPSMIYWTVLIGLQRTGSFKVKSRNKWKSPRNFIFTCVLTIDLSELVRDSLMENLGLENRHFNASYSNFLSFKGSHANKS